MTMFRPTRIMSMANNPPARLLREARWATTLAALLLSATLGGAQDKPSAPAPTPAPVKAEFVGSDTCQGCHEDLFNSFKKNPHHQVETDKKRGFETKACEACHGPGSKHAESMSAADIRNPAKLKPAETDRLCLTCHLNQPTHVGRLTGSHARNQVSCTSCHSMHKSEPDSLVARKAPEINKLCAGCHTDVWASFQRQFTHKLPQGAMSCVDCHNPHGTFLPKSMQTVKANEPGCLNCHGDKAGPFVYEHAPVKMEGCVACHQPHGSANPRMLTRATMRLVCLECHSNLPTATPAPTAKGTLGTIGPAIHDLNSPRFQNCTNCHQRVHGSNVSRDLFK
jgi:DmsE family decaheme c-type cytochrome